MVIELLKRMEYELMAIGQSMRTNLQERGLFDSDSAIEMTYAEERSWLDRLEKLRKSVSSEIETIESLDALLNSEE